MASIVEDNSKNFYPTLLLNQDTVEIVTEPLYPVISKKNSSTDLPSKKKL